jgi:hypothetical protein
MIKQKAQIALIAIITILMCLMVAPTQAQQVKWSNLYIIDSNAGAGVFSSLAVDTTNSVSVCYVNAVTGNAMSTFSQTGWAHNTISVIDSNSNTAVVTDNTGTSYDLFTSGGDLTEAYGAYNQIPTVSQILYNSNVVSGEVGSLGLIGAGQLALAYLNGNDLIYSLISGYQMQAALQLTTDAQGGMRNVSMVMDASGLPHIAYYTTNGTLKYEYEDAGAAWHTQIVDNTPGHDVGQFNSIGIDSKGIVSISYYDATTDSLDVAQQYNGGWTLKTVPTLGGGAGQYSSLVVNPTTDNLYVAYYDDQNHDLRLATYNAALKTWSDTLVDGLTGYNIGQDANLGTSDMQNFFVSYVSSSGTTGSQLKVAAGSVPEPTSLFALGGGLAGIIGLLRRRRA